VFETCFSCADVTDHDVDSQLESADEDSPFAEVRAAVSNIDDPTIPVNTFRVWFIGCFLISLAT